MCWQVDATAWGLVTSHPYAVKAIETATSRRCDPALIARRAAALVESSRVPYASTHELRCDNSQSLINTQFYVDHSEVNDIISRLNDWPLGLLEDGYEFFAFTFRDQ